MYNISQTIRRVKNPANLSYARLSDFDAIALRRLDKPCCGLPSSGKIDPIASVAQGIELGFPKPCIAQVRILSGALAYLYGALFAYLGGGLLVCL